MEQGNKTQRTPVNKQKLATNRDLSYQKLVKKIQETTKELIATKNGRSIFNNSAFNKTGNQFCSS